MTVDLATVYTFIVLVFGLFAVSLIILGKKLMRRRF